MSKDLNIDLKTLPKKIKHAVNQLQRYTVIIFIVSVLGLYGFLVVQISRASRAEPKDDAVTAQLNNVKRLKVDQQSIDKIQQLEDQNVGVQSLFEAARENPFQDE